VCSAVVVCVTREVCVHPPNGSFIGTAKTANATAVQFVDRLQDSTMGGTLSPQAHNSNNDRPQLVCDAQRLSPVCVLGNLPSFYLFRATPLSTAGLFNHVQPTTAIYNISSFRSQIWP